MLDEANLHIAQLKNRDWRSAILIDTFSKRHDDDTSLLRTVAQEQIQRQNELHSLRALSATAEMNIQHECELHKVTKKSLKHEREVTLRLTDYVKHLSENFSIEYIPKLRYLEQVIEQMEKDSQAKDALIEDQQTTCDLLEEERDSIIAARACSV